MPMYITYAKYSHSGVKGMIDKPTDRTGAIKALIEKSGGKIAVYMTTGSHDVVIVSEAPAGTDRSSGRNGSSSKRCCFQN